MEQSFFIALLLVLLDGVLIVCFILLWRRRSRLPEGSQELKQNLQQLINEMNGMTATFATNLEERMAIVQRVTAQLDEKIREAEKMVKDLDRVKQKEPPSRSAKTPPKNSEGEQVVLLAKKGLDAEAIARKLQKPVGEVELILNLKKLSLENR